MSSSVAQNLTKNLKNFFSGAGFKKAVIGISGGVDSAATLKLAVDALGAENVYGLIMPEKSVTRSQNHIDALELAKMLKIDFSEVFIDDYIKVYNNLPWNPSSFANMNLRARTRMIILYHYANTHNALVLGTGNKTEILLGYGTKYGDFGIDVEVLGELYKTEVFQLAKDLGLPETFYTKVPSAELHEGQTDEGEIGASYAQIDSILQAWKNNTQQTEKPELVDKILERCVTNAHKTEPIPVIKAYS